MTKGHNEAEAELKAFTADDDAAGARLDQWLAGQTAPELSRNRIKQLIEQGNVRLNGTRVTEPKRKVKSGDIVEIAMPEPEAPEPLAEDIPLSVLHEDDDVVVIDKPAGLVVHPGPGNPAGTLVNALIAHCGDSLSGIGGVRRPGIVHRLDRDTSGVMVVAKNDRAHQALSAQFADHGRTTEMERAYLALVWGTPDRMTGKIETFLGRSSRDRMKQAVVPEGRPDARHAVTHFRVIERFGDPSGATPVASLVECRLETGRTHQIRVHMAHIGHPLIGDQYYGKSFATKAKVLPEPLRRSVEMFGRQALHAAHLAFNHPATGELMRFETPLPADMMELVAGFRRFHDRT
ncbi:RluA family pseudouridine synthase [Oricola indica]|uniref:RluA family pseudouridine synthase n=1 Tax=Oricola indica TaxID=2872591 RepID=UPI003CCC1FB9